MSDDAVGLLVAGFVLTAIILALTAAAVVAIPVAVIGGGGYLWWKKHNNSEATQAKRQMNELQELYGAIEAKINLTGSPSAAEVAAAAVEVAEGYLHAEIPTAAQEVAYSAAVELLRAPGLSDLPSLDYATLLANSQLRSEFRQQLYAIDEARQYGSNPLEVYAEYLGRCLAEILADLPPDLDLDATDAPLSCQLIDLLPNGRTSVGNVLAAAFEVDENGVLLEPEREQIRVRLAQIAGKTIDDLNKQPHRVPKAKDDPRSPREVATAFLAGSPFLTLLLRPVGYELPAAARVEHMHCLAGSGHGKTQLLQSFIKADLAALERHVADPDTYPAQSVVVIDSQGDLIRNIASRQIFAPGQPLADRLVLIDPTDILHPPALNMFDVGQDKFADMRPSDRAALYNGTVELYVYLFSELLEANLTARQATLFRFLAQLLLIIPEANLLTFLSVLENDEEYLSYAEQLDSTAQMFFTTQYLSDEFKGPKKEIAWRLWGLISNSALASMFNSPQSKIDLDAELQRGAVVLINTAKDTLKSEGSKLFGRFWVAMLAQAAIKRAQVAPPERTLTYVYLDEAHEIVDSKAEEILNQARKYKIGLTISHQNLGQLRDNSTRASVAASTAIKMVGGASDKDARAYAGDLRSSAETILAAKKRANSSEFVTFVKNHQSHGVTLSFPFGQLEGLEKASSDERQGIREANWEKYCHEPSKAAERAAPEEPEETTATTKEETTAPEYEFKLGEPEDL